MNSGQPREGAGLKLKPPVPGSHATAAQPSSGEKRKPGSFFERLTSSLRDHDSGMEDDMGDQSSAASGEDQGDQGQGGYRGQGLRAAPRLQSAPAQGSLNIDSPAGQRPQSDEELDIPAFLRRQAN